MEGEHKFLHCPDVVKWSKLNQMCVIPRNKDVIILGGQCGYDVNENLADGIEGQTRVTFDNIKKLLEFGGSSMDNLVSLNVFLSTSLTDEEEARFNEVYCEIFPNPETRPCRCCTRVVLQDDMKIEVVNVIATKK